MYVPYRTAYLAGIVQGWGKCPRISEAGQRPKAFPTRDQLTWPLFFVYSTEHWICTYNIVVQRGNVDLVDIISCTPSPLVMSKGLISMC